MIPINISCHKYRLSLFRRKTTVNSSLKLSKPTKFNPVHVQNLQYKLKWTTDQNLIAVCFQRSLTYNPIKMPVILEIGIHLAVV